MKIRYKPAIQEDIPIILKMMEEFYVHENIPFTAEKSRSTLNDFISKEHVGKIWIIQVDNEPIGYCCLVFSYTLEYHGHDCFLDEIFIRPDFQDMGIGTKTLSYLEQYSVDNGIKAMHLFVFDENKNAFEFYKKKGFVRRGGSLMVKIFD